MRLPVVAAALALAACPAAARAATVGIYVPPCQEEQSKYGQCYPDEARYKAAPGERNDLTISTGSDPRGVSYTFHDSGAAVHADPTCDQVDDHTATCASTSLVPIVDAGDGDDKVDGPGQIDGGPGNDVLSGSSLSGGPGDDHLTGTDQADVLNGGPGHDTISAGAGNDTIEDGGDGYESDVIDGGTGVDLLAYDGRKDALVVFLGPPPANEDQITGIENVRGGNGNDGLVGDAGPNTIDGGPGNDTVNGGAGDDILSGGAGSDRLIGGAGDDRLDPGDAKASNVLDCGPGTDTVEPARTAVVYKSCEFVDLEESLIDGTLRLNLRAKGARPIATWSRPSCLDRPCTLSMTATDRGKLLGSSIFSARTRRTELPHRLSLRLRGPRPPTASVRVVLNDGGDRSSVAFRVRL